MSENEETSISLLQKRAEWLHKQMVLINKLPSALDGPLSRYNVVLTMVSPMILTQCLLVPDVPITALQMTMITFSLDQVCRYFGNKSKMAMMLHAIHGLLTELIRRPMLIGVRFLLEALVHFSGSTIEQYLRSPWRRVCAIGSCAEVAFELAQQLIRRPIADITPVCVRVEQNKIGFLQANHTFVIIETPHGKRYRVCAWHAGGAVVPDDKQEITDEQKRRYPMLCPSDNRKVLSEFTIPDGFALTKTCIA